MLTLLPICFQPTIFNPQALTTLPGSAPPGIAAVGSWFGGTLTTLATTFRLVTAEATKTIFNEIGATLYGAGMIAWADKVSGAASKSLETIFNRDVNISVPIGDLQQNMTYAWPFYTEQLLSDIPPSDDNDDTYKGAGFAYNVTMIPQILASGAFAEPLPSYSTDTIANLTAALVSD